MLSIEMARVGAIVRIDEVFPLAGVYPPTFTKAVADRYSFVYPPDWSVPISEMQAKGMEFRVGKFRAADGKEQVIQNLNIIALGVVASAYSTDIAEEFLRDLFSWADKEYQCRFLSSELRFFFLSQLIVEFDKPLNSLVRSFELLSAAIGGAIESTYGTGYRVEVSSIGFDYDRTSAVEDMKQLSPFVVERQVGKQFSSNSFFCQAPLGTQDHVSLLEQLESQLTG